MSGYISTPFISGVLISALEPLTDFCDVLAAERERKGRSCNFIFPTQILNCPWN